MISSNQAGGSTKNKKDKRRNVTVASLDRIIRDIRQVLDILDVSPARGSSGVKRAKSFEAKLEEKIYNLDSNKKKQNRNTSKTSKSNTTTITKANPKPTKNSNEHSNNDTIKPITTKITTVVEKKQANITSKNVALAKVLPALNLSSVLVKKADVEDNQKIDDAPNANNPSENKIAALNYCNKKTFLPRTREPLRPYMISLTELKAEVARAVKQRKTFGVRGNFPEVRNALLRRGWIEKFPSMSPDAINRNIGSSLKYKTITELLELMKIRHLTEICKKLIKSKLLTNNQVDFLWGYNDECFLLNAGKTKSTKINRIKRDCNSYSNKQGLSDAAKNSQWQSFSKVARINHPRTYILSRNGEMDLFVKDFRRTAAVSLLKWVLNAWETRKTKVISVSGKVSIDMFQFALGECLKIIKENESLSISNNLKDEASDEEWTKFLTCFYNLVHSGSYFKKNGLETESTMAEKSSFIIRKLSHFYRNLAMDGVMNVWIMKPVVGSQGRGITICRTLSAVEQTMKENSNIKYLIQKYIERPLLIFNTKFDIRQWFLISSTSPLTIWMYKECYLRFSSQPFSLRKLHESIHLTNNSIQKKYENVPHEVSSLPNYNMWGLSHFKTFLASIGQPEVFDKIIYKGMQECLIGAVVSHQDKICVKKNCFELYGADFMITEDFRPWLLEINSQPALHASTPVTSKLCPQVIEDTIKVVVDLEENPKAKTGNFEMIYRQQNVLKVEQKNADTPLSAGKDSMFPPKPRTAKNNEEVQIQDGIKMTQHARLT